LQEDARDSEHNGGQETAGEFSTGEQFREQQRDLAKRPKKNDAAE